ncbi:MAG: MFS transporter [Candidatus Heimdallarchaeota archaeon]|nr:MFS transporter [Candidatus Heimdallarchaeota archaeon]MDH5647973.1 MFS transporter [Candidatus Heimdallarchaeota archaeon]
MILSFFSSIGGSIVWFTPTWLIYSLGGDNEDLGDILGITTIITLFASMIGSIIADRFRRDIIIWIGNLLTLAGIYILANSYQLSDIFNGLIITNLGFSLSWPAISGLFANSIPSKNRNRVFGTNFLLSNLASAFGNIIGYYIFLDTGSNLESIDPSLLRYSLIIAFYFQIIAVIICFFAKDTKGISVEEEGSAASKHETMSINKNTGFVNDFTQNAILILSITLLSSIFIGFGAGISIPYFPRFFFDIYHLDLSSLNLVFAALTIVTAVWGKFTANIGDRFGRVQVIVANQMVAVILLYLLALYPPFILAIAALLVRNAVMNGTGPLINSIQMDYTPRKYRSQINAINNLGWSLFFGLGQIFGGKIVERIGFWLAFVITATLYLIASIIYLKIKKLDTTHISNLSDDLKN